MSKSTPTGHSNSHNAASGIPAGVTGEYLEIEGFIDGIADGKLLGWAWDEFDPSATVSVELFHNNTRIASVTADEFRRDLLDAGKGDGRHGFSFHLPTALRDPKVTDFRIKIAGTSVELFAPPHRFRLPASQIPLPPESLLVLTGHPDATPFFSLGEDVATVCRKYGRLRSTGSILDIGCGVGYLAIPLTQYLGEDGRYEGIDIVADAIEWCRQHITPTYPNFQFRHADVHSRFYNPRATITATEYKIPYAAEQFDVVFLGSVFTHLLPAEIENYLAEIARVLAKGGRCLITYFLLNEQGGLKYEKDKPADLHFQFKGPGYRTTNREIPEAAVAYDEAYIHGLYAKNGLRIVEPIHMGAQDMVVAVK